MVIGLFCCFLGNALCISVVPGWKEVSLMSGLCLDDWGEFCSCRSSAGSLQRQMRQSQIHMQSTCAVNRIWTIQMAWVLRTMVCTTSFGLPGFTCRFQNLSAKSRRCQDRKHSRRLDGNQPNSCWWAERGHGAWNIWNLRSFLQIQTQSIYGILWALSVSCAFLLNIWFSCEFAPTMVVGRNSLKLGQTAFATRVAKKHERVEPAESC